MVTLFTKEQKNRPSQDKSRDRSMTTSGYKVLRFTGSEVYKDPTGVVGEIEAFLIQESLKFVSPPRLP
jgi:very-short-patch-repair endonuclease